jgi:hypothetical protein
MARLDVRVPRDTRTRGLPPGVESDLHAVSPRTRLCAPLLPAFALPRVFPDLNPAFEIAGARYVMVTRALAP